MVRIHPEHGDAAKCGCRRKCRPQRTLKRQVQRPWRAAATRPGSNETACNPRRMGGDSRRTAPFPGGAATGSTSRGLQARAHHKAAAPVVASRTLAGPALAPHGLSHPPSQPQRRPTRNGDIGQGTRRAGSSPHGTFSPPAAGLCGVSVSAVARARATSSRPAGPRGRQATTPSGRTSVAPPARSP
jgi:hypothetical protein